MKTLQANDQALCQEFSVTSPGTALNAVRELQLMLIGLGAQDTSRARHFLEHATKLFRARAAASPNTTHLNLAVNGGPGNDSAQSLYSQTSFSSTTNERQAQPPRSPRWVISESEIKIDENSPLGRGGFGTVFKRQWNGAIVAVKRLVKDASAEVSLRLLCCFPHCFPLLPSLVYRASF